MIDSSSSAPTSPSGIVVVVRRWNRVLNVLGPFLALAAVVLVFGVADQLLNDKPSFFTSRNLTTMSAQTATVAVAALGMTVIIIAGGIDLSAGTAIALCATVLAWCLKEDVATLLVARDNVASVTSQLKDSQQKLDRVNRELESLAAKSADKSLVAEKLFQRGTHSADVERLQRRLTDVRQFAERWSKWSPAIGLLAAIGCGCLCGFVNGVLVSYLRVVPFIVTLGTMQLYLGLAKQIAQETTVRPERATQIPDWFANLLSVRGETLWFGLPSGVWLALLLAGLLAAVLRWTVFSRYVFALGSNEATARLCGINVRCNKIAVYTLGGLFVGIAGLYQFSRLTVGNPTSGTGLELKVIAAVVIGGGSLSGGRGTVLGTLTGALIMSVITSGCTMLGLKNPVQDMILGVIIVAAVTLDQLRQKASRRSPL
jgi:ribose/xylose/arabinose/galactoside ABC-type transport system permease subunit